MQCFSCDTDYKQQAGYVWDSKSWFFCLNPNQAYLGRAVLVLKRHIKHIPEILPEEWVELKTEIEKVEAVYRKTFAPDLFNWSCLNNNAYRGAPEEWNPHLHWHVLPRYSVKKELHGTIYEDTDFGHHYNRYEQRYNPVSDEILSKIAAEIRRNL